MSRVLELGAGDLTQANALTDCSVVAIDKQVIGTPLSHVTFIQGDYFNIQIDGIFDTILCDYTLCFNRRERIETALPDILSHLKPGGSLLINDFSVDDPVVIKRTNLDADWFFILLRMHVGKLAITRESVFEQEHQHVHHILHIKAIKTTTYASVIPAEAGIQDQNH